MSTTPGTLRSFASTHHSDDMAVVSINHGIGLPAKVHGGARAYHVDERTFLTDLDAFGGASGAPVFTATGQLLGVLSAGSPDYVPTPQGCMQTMRAEPGRDHANELVVRTQTAIDSLCQGAGAPELCPDERGRQANGCALLPRVRDLPAVEIVLAGVVLLRKRRRRVR
jgi:hypothetical protein